MDVVYVLDSKNIIFYTRYVDAIYNIGHYTHYNQFNS
jgi:hypothetical protein